MGQIGGRAGQRGRALVFVVALAVALACMLAACGPTQAARPKTSKAASTATPAAHGWNLVSSPTVGAEGSLVAVSALSTTDAWAVGQYQGPASLQQTLAEHWDGSQWSVVSSPSPGGEFNILQGVSADAPNDAWAVGYATDNKGISQPLIEHWNGSAWSVSAGVAGGSGGGQLNGVAALSPRDVWAVGFTGNLGANHEPIGNSVLIEHWNGSVWSSVPDAGTGASAGDEGIHSLTAVAALAPSDVWAVGPIGGPSPFEHWDGTRWAVVPAAGLNGYALSSIAAISSSDVWAVGAGHPGSPAACGAGGSVVIAHWDGTQWSNVPFPTPSGQQSDDFSLASVAAVASNDVWAVGGTLSYYRGKSAAFAPAIEHWDGSAWSIVAGPQPNTVEGLAGVAASRDGAVWAIGQAEAANGPGATHVERYSGGQWTTVDSPSPGTLSNELKSIAAISPSDMWAVGDSSGGTLTEHWNGSAWGYYPSPNGAPADDSLNAVAASSSNDIWAVGSIPGQGAGYATTSLVEHWNGSQWATVADAAAGDQTRQELLSVAALSAHDVWAVGEANGPFAEHWDGSEWTAVATAATLPGGDLSDSALLGVAAVAPNDVWAVGGTPPHSCGGQTPALIEHWDGTQWSIIPNTPTGLLYGVAAVSAKDVWAVGDGPGTFVMHYDGASWSVVSMPATPQGVSLHLGAVAARVPNDVWAVGSLYSQQQGQSGVILHWNGTTWSQLQVTRPGMTASVLHGVAIAAPGNVWAVGSYSSLAYLDPNSQQALIEHYTP